MAIYTYNVAINSGKFGDSVGLGFSHSEPISLATNDIIRFTTSQTTHEFLPIFPGGGFTLTSGTLNSNSYCDNSGDPYDYRYDGEIGSSNVTVNGSVTAKQDNTFIFASGATFQYRNSSDSTPSTGDQILTDQTASTTVTKTFTVAGLASGKKCTYRITSGFDTGNTAIRKSGGTYASSTVAVANGDTVQIRTTSLDVPGLTKVVPIEGVDLTGTNVRSFEFKVTTSEDTDSAYGVETFNSSGVKTLSLTSRTSRWVTSGTASASVAANSTGTINVSVSGLQNTDIWRVLATPKNYMTIVSDITKSSGQFTLKVKNSFSTTQTLQVDYIVVLTG